MRRVAIVAPRRSVDDGVVARLSGVLPGTIVDTTMLRPGNASEWLVVSARIERVTEEKSRSNTMSVTMTNAITATRAAIGVSCWATPVFASRLFGVDVREDRSAKFYLKLGGTRDLALAAGAATTVGPARRQALRIAAACDVADIAATVITRREGNVSKVGTALWFVASSACFAMTLGAIRETKAR